MKLLPIPTTEKHLLTTEPLWLPFLQKISKRSKEPIANMVVRIYSGEVHVILVWDEVAQRAVALAGVLFRPQGDELVAEFVWLTGTDRETWQQLLPELESYLKQQAGCALCRPICRPGWSKFLKAHGYRATHVVMEKAL